MTWKHLRKLITIFTILFLASISTDSVQACDEDCFEVLSSCESQVAIITSNAYVDCKSAYNKCAKYVHDNYTQGTIAYSDALDVCLCDSTDCEHDADSQAEELYADCDEEYQDCLENSPLCVWEMIPIISYIMLF